MGCGSSNDQKDNVNLPQHSDKINYNNFITSHKDKSYKEDYQIGKLLGEGGFGQVYVCKNKKNNEVRVLKKMAKDALTDEELKKNMVQDVQVLQHLAHPSIIKTFEFYTDDNMFYIVSEFCEGGALLDRVIAQDMLSEKETANVLKQVVEAVNYSHLSGIMHRDIKLENIVLDEQAKSDTQLYPVKLIDFGCSTNFVRGKTYDEVCGTPIYIAPEVLKEKYNEKCDVWSLGVLMYILLSGSPPFVGDDMDELFENIKKGKFSFSDASFPDISKEAEDLIKKMLNTNYEKRISAAEVLQHPWFINAQDIKLNDEGKKKALKNLTEFQINNKLQSAILSYISNQLITKAEQKNLAVAFKEIDKDGSGTLSKEEIKEYFTQFMDNEELEASVNEIMNKLDENGNGTVNYNEFITASIDMQQMVSDKNLKDAFNFFDADKNGFITTGEIKKILGNQKQIDTKQLLDQIASYDKDGNDKLDLEEFKQMMKNINNKDQKQ